VAPSPGGAPTRTPLDGLDPSVALGFHCRDRADFAHLARGLARIANGELPGASLPLSIEKTRPRLYHHDEDIDIEDDGLGATGSDSDIETEFVVIEKHI